MKIFKVVLPLLITSLVGCVNGVPLPSGFSTNTQNTELVVVGVPLLLSMSGSAARLDDEWMVTAAHNKFILESTGKEVFYHPTCDIALYRSKGTNTVPLGVFHIGDELSHVGYYLGVMQSENPGTFVSTIKSLENPDCDADVITTATAGQGMSGGGVYNSANELVGTTVAFYYETMTITGSEAQVSKVVNPTSFVALYNVRDWLTEITGKTYF